MNLNATSFDKIKKYIVAVLEAVFRITITVILSFGTVCFSIVGLLLLYPDNYIKTAEKTFWGSSIILFCAVVYIGLAIYAFRKVKLKRFLIFHAIPGIITLVVSYAWASGMI